MIISSNMPALKIHNQLVRTNRKTDSSMQRLSTGLRINSASDDPSGLAVSNKLRMEINGLATVSQNALDGASIIQTADSALEEITAMLQRMRELSVQAANDTLTDEDREIIQLEMEQLLEEVDTVGKNTAFNGRSLFFGTFEQLDADGNVEHIHGRIMVRTGTGKDEFMFMDFPEVSAAALGLDDIDIRLDGGATDAISLFDDAISQVSIMRANLGAYENRLEYTASILDVTGINMQAALSRMVDTDMALEMAELSRLNVLSQAGLSVLSQANQLPQQVLQFLN